jgi:hypothetical protein
MIKAPICTNDQLNEARAAAIEVFRKRRMEEPLEEYLQAFDVYQGVVEELLEITVDLSELDEHVVDLLTDKKHLEALRYLAGPPVSYDDLLTLSEVPLSPTRLRAKPESAQAVAQILLNGLDRRRFPWVTQGREPTESERSAAVIASASLLATSRVGTNRRSEDKTNQENEVMATLQAAGLTRTSTRDIPVLSAAPGRGEFCPESKLGTRKADIVVGLWDGRVMPIECKVSNSSTNSVKRLNNDAAVKASSWKSDFGTVQVVPAAVLSGVYKLHNLLDAQARGLTIFWSHNLVELTTWIEATKAG